MCLLPATACKAGRGRPRPAIPPRSPAAGTQVVKAFDLVAARTGLTRRRSRAALVHRGSTGTSLGVRRSVAGRRCGGTKVPAGAALRPLPARTGRADGVDVNSSTAVEATPAEVSGLDSAALLGVVADPVRWRLLAALAAAAHCVCELQPVGGVAPNLLSYHLRVLREAGLVTATRRGRWIDYALADDALDRLHAALPAPVGISRGCH